MCMTWKKGVFRFESHLGLTMSVNRKNERFGKLLAVPQCISQSENAARHVGQKPYCLVTVLMKCDIEEVKTQQLKR